MKYPCKSFTIIHLVYQNEFRTTVVGPIIEFAIFWLGGQDKGKLFEKVKNQTVEATQVLLAQELDLEIKRVEKKIHQQDGSVRREVTFTKEQEAELQRVREIISHTHPNPTFAELVTHLAQEFLSRKDPLRQKTKSKKDSGMTEAFNKESPVYRSINDLSVESSSNLTGCVSATEAVPSQNQTFLRDYIHIATRRFIFQRDRVCQKRNPKTGQLCGSRFQLQVDHIQPVWAGGGNEPSNLHLLCSAHNRFKYKVETNTQTLSDRRVPYLIKSRVVSYLINHCRTG